MSWREKVKQMAGCMKITVRFDVIGIGLLSAQFAFLAAPVLAHRVEISGDIGGTMHIEPNDNPRAGEPGLTWFALTRPGGERVPLSACDCQLRVFAQPYQPNSLPIQTPPLKPVSAEGYEGIPGAEITFPQVGAYELVLEGKPTTPGDFESFQLRFDVTVASGQVAPTPETPTPETSIAASPSPDSIATAPTQTSQPKIQPWLVGMITVSGTAIALWLLRWRRSRNKSL